MLAQDCSGLPSTKAGRNWHLDKPALAASSSRLKPELFSISDWITLPSTPTRKRKATVPSSSRRRDALGYSGFSHWLTFTPAAVRVGAGAGAVAREGAAAAGAVAAGAAAGAAAWGVVGAEAVKPALDGVGVLTGGQFDGRGRRCRRCWLQGLRRRRFDNRWRRRWGRSSRRWWRFSRCVREQQRLNHGRHFLHHVACQAHMHSPKQQGMQKKHPSPSRQRALGAGKLERGG